MVLIVNIVFDIVSLNRVSLIGLLSMCSIVFLLLIAIIAFMSISYRPLLLDVLILC